MSSASNETATVDAPVTVYRRYDDGYIVRSMTRQDSITLQRWYAALVIGSKYDLDVALSAFPASSRGFYIGEFQGEIVACAVRLPWGDDVCYGSYYYVDKPHRGRGYGTRLRDEVAREHVGNRKLCIDAVIGKVSDDNEKKFGYRPSFKSARFRGVAKPSCEQSITVASVLPVSLCCLLILP
jgi:GNAT superfamily N-acetyltransferase